MIARLGTKDLISYSAALLVLGLVIVVAMTGGHFKAVPVLLAAVATGCLFGFIFGLPRLVEFTAPPPGTAEKISGLTGDGQTPDKIEVSLKNDGWTNYNLVAISDWLTKAIIAVALVKLEAILTWIGTAGSQVSTAMAIKDGDAIGASILVLGFTLGFMSMYVFSRTRLARFFFEQSAYVRDMIKSAQETQRKLEINSNLLERMKRILPASDLAAIAATNSLYQDPPESYENARETIKMFFEGTEESFKKQHPRLNTLLACAYGQEFTHKTLQNATFDKKPLADSAFEAIQRAILGDGNQKHILRSFFDPTDINFNPSDADLVDFYHDEEIRVRFERVLCEAAATDEANAEEGVVGSQ